MREAGYASPMSIGLPLVVISAAVIILSYYSLQPIARLKAEMPPEFVDAPPSATQKQVAAERRVAESYWNCAVTIIQWKYFYGSPLPEDPPEDFRINETTVQDRAPATISHNSRGRSFDAGPTSFARQRYWRRLQQLWTSPVAWSFSREWQFEWLPHGIRQAFDWIDGLVSGSR